MAIQAEPGLEIAATLYAPYVPKNRQRVVLLVNEQASLAARFARQGYMTLNAMPRGLPLPASHELAGDWKAATRAWVIGRNLAVLRATDILRAAEMLTFRSGVPAPEVVAAARGVDGFPLLLAAAARPIFARVWLDGTPYSFAQAMEAPLTRNLHAAVIPGFALKWDMEDLVKAISPRQVIWSDPTDWMGNVVPRLAGKLYRVMDEGDDRFVRALLAP